MALNNQPKLKQIQGGAQLRADVNSLLPLLTSYEASKVLTTIQNSTGDGVLSVADVLTSLLSASSSSDTEIGKLSTALETLKNTPISDYVRLLGKVQVTKNEEEVYDASAFDGSEYTSEYVTANIQAVDTSSYETSTVTAYDEAVATLTSLLTDVSDKDTTLANISSINTKVKTVKADSNYNTYSEEFKANVAFLETAYASLMATYESANTTNVTYSNIATLNDADKLEELVPNLQSTEAFIYTTDNKPIVDKDGNQIKYNFVTDTLTSGIPSIADYSGEEIKYVPIEGETVFKVFPVGSFTIGSLPEDYLLDNEEMNLVYYSKAIDELAFSISKNSEIIDSVKSLIGEKAVADQLAEVSNKLQAQITANKTALDGLLADEAVEGSVAYQIKALETSLTEVTNGLNTRLTTAEGAINTLNGDETTEGSVAKAVKDLNDSLAPRVTANENAITKLNGDKETTGSVLNTVHSITDGIDTRLTTAEGTLATAVSNIATLNGDENTAGSVAKSIKDATAQKFTDLETADTSMTTRIDNIIGTDTETTETITSLDSRLDAIEGKTDQWNGNTLYTNSTPIVQAHGGITVGETFENVSITDMLTKILYPYIKPTISLAGTPSAGIREIGEEISSVDLVSTVDKKSRDITKVDFYLGSTLVGTVDSNVANGGRISYTYQNAKSEEVYDPETDKTNTVVNVTPITTDTTFKAVVTDSDNGTVTSNTISYTFVNPVYYGKTTATNEEITSAVIKSLTKKVQNKSNISTTYASLNEERMIIACPAGWTISSVLDPNGFDMTNSFETLTVAVECLDGTDKDYTVYVSAPTSQSNFTVTYKC